MAPAPTAKVFQDALQRNAATWCHSFTESPDLTQHHHLSLIHSTTCTGCVLCFRCFSGYLHNRDDGNTYSFPVVVLSNGMPEWQPNAPRANKVWFLWHSLPPWEWGAHKITCQWNWKAFRWWGVGSWWKLPGLTLGECYFFLNSRPIFLIR